MKIPQSFRQSYARVRPVLERLEEVVKPRAQSIAFAHEGAYSGRIKTAESVLIKAEQEGYERPLRQMDDLFACTITVPNFRLIEQVRTEVEATFQLVEVRQRALKPDEFAYNDLNLSLRVGPDFWNRGEGYLQFVFELQIKTLLQEAWSRAEHDVVYKGRRRTWGLTRITRQLRALLEMADSVLSNLEGASDALQGPREYAEYSRMNQLVSMLEDNWATERLPSDLYRLAEVVDAYVELAGSTCEEMKSLLAKDEYARYVEARSLTPTQTVFITLFCEKWQRMQPRLGDRKVLVTPEMLDLCPQLSAIPPRLRMQFSDGASLRYQ